MYYNKLNEYGDAYIIICWEEMATPSEGRMGVYHRCSDVKSTIELELVALPLRWRQRGLVRSGVGLH
jgi:hypothetical protein